MRHSLTLWTWSSSLFYKCATAYRGNAFFPRYLFSGKRKREEKKHLSNPHLPPQHHCAKQRAKATGVAVRGHTAAVASTQPNKSLPGMRSASCFPSETVQCLCTEENAGGFLLRVPNFFSSAGFSLPTLPLTLAVFLWIAFKWKFQSLQNRCI